MSETCQKSWARSTPVQRGSIWAVCGNRQQWESVSNAAWQISTSAFIVQTQTLWTCRKCHHLTLIVGFFTEYFKDCVIKPWKLKSRAHMVITFWLDRFWFSSQHSEETTVYLLFIYFYLYFYLSIKNIDILIIFRISKR